MTVVVVVVVVVTEGEQASVPKQAGVLQAPGSVQDLLLKCGRARAEVARAETTSVLRSILIDCRRFFVLLF